MSKHKNDYSDQFLRKISPFNRTKYNMNVNFCLKRVRVGLISDPNSGSDFSQTAGCSIVVAISYVLYVRCRLIFKCCKCFNTFVCPIYLIQ